MPLDVAMPKLSDSMEEGTVLRWLKAVGDPVRRGDELVEVETDKATIVYEAELDGVLAEVLVPEGAVAPVGRVIARIDDGRAVAAGPAAPVVASAPPASAPPATAPPPPVAAAAGPRPGRARATPVARRTALELGVQLATLSGSGPGGRIVRADVRRAAAAAPAAADAPAPPVAEAPARAHGDARGPATVVPLTATQQTIARRMAEARASIPTFTVAVEVDATAALALQRDLRAHAAEQAPSLNDLVVKASALTLRDEPRFNAAYVDGALHRFERVNVAIAIATEDALYVPAVLDADRKSVTEIASETRAFAERARARSLTVEELTAGTFTVSNLGMLGVVRFEAIVNPPQVAILAVGAAVRRPVVAADGTIAARDVMELTLSSDHRAVYGADAARFLRRLRELLERPAVLLLS